MSSRVSASNLTQAVRELLASWERAKIHWRDAKSQEFEARFLEKLPHDVAQARTAMEELDVLLRKVRNDCE